MMKRMAGMTALACALAVGIGFQDITGAQQAARKPDAETKPEMRRGQGQDPNIKQTREQVLKEKPQLPAPAEKTGEKTRQAICRVVFDSYTNEWIDAYADGTYRGSVPPYGELVTYVIAGPTRVFGASATRTWGPRTFTCNTEYWWRLLN